MNAPVALVTMVEPVMTQLDRTPAFVLVDGLEVVVKKYISICRFMYQKTHTQIYLYLLIFLPIKLSIYSSTWSVHQIYQMLHLSNILSVTNQKC